MRLYWWITSRARSAVATARIRVSMVGEFYSQRRPLQTPAGLRRRLSAIAFRPTGGSRNAVLLERFGFDLTVRKSRIVSRSTRQERRGRHPAGIRYIDLTCHSESVTD